MPSVGSGISLGKSGISTQAMPEWRLEYDIIGNLDADVSFDAEYFEFLLGKFADNLRLGVAGTPYRRIISIHYRFTSIEHVSGQCQLFRRECFEEIGGFDRGRSGR